MNYVTAAEILVWCVERRYDFHYCGGAFGHQVSTAVIEARKGGQTVRHWVRDTPLTEKELAYCRARPKQFDLAMMERSAADERRENRYMLLVDNLSQVDK